jgi:hypothetical protein
LTLAQHHGLDADRGDLLSLLPTDDLRLDLLLVMHAARKLGFDATPLEGDFEHLPEVPRPNIVRFRDDAFAVLYEIDERSTLVGDPATGTVARLSKEEFERRWTGDAVQLDADAGRLAQTRAILAARRSPNARLLRDLGISPRAPRRWLFPPVLVATLAALTGQKSGVLLALASCVLLSTLSFAYAADCRSCKKGAALAGALPVAALGMIGYATLFALGRFAPGSSLLSLGVAAAAGVHVGLMAQLARARVVCVPCLLTAICAWTAAGLTVAVAPLTLAIAVAGSVAALAATHLGRRLFELEVAANSLAVARRVAAEPAPTDGKIAIVVYKRANCPVCAYYEASVRPTLEEALGERVIFDEREPGRAPLVTPLLVVRGAASFAFIGLSTETGCDAVLRAAELAAQPEAAALAAVGALAVVVSA